MGTVHPNKRGQNVGELATPGVVFCGARHGQLLDLGGDTASRLMLLKKRVHQVKRASWLTWWTRFFNSITASRLMLLKKRVHQVNQLARFSKTRKQVILLQPLMVILYKVADDSGSVRQNSRIEILLRLQPSAMLLVD